MRNPTTALRTTTATVPAIVGFIIGAGLGLFGPSSDGLVAIGQAMTRSNSVAELQPD